jgi:hypothetical protein
MKGLHLVEVFEDAGISASKSLASRPASSQLLVIAAADDSFLGHLGHAPFGPPDGLHCACEFYTHARRYLAA